MNATAIVRAAIPGADADTVEHVLWDMTPFPVGRVGTQTIAQTIYQAASRLRRATANGIALCDHCKNRAAPNDCCCATCRRALSGALETESKRRAATEQ